MQMYVNYYIYELMNEGDTAPNCTAKTNKMRPLVHETILPGINNMHSQRRRSHETNY